jgi:L-asparaginase
MIEILTTGGTIAKKYDEISGRLSFDERHLQQILQQGRNRLEVKVQALMLKDSLEMDERDREIIYHACSHSLAESIMIVHGTDTMVETAEKLSTIKEKTILLVGAMIPYAFKGSDALFNIGCALGAVQVLDDGVYIVMNGKIFPWDRVVKDKKLGEFIER